MLSEPTLSAVRGALVRGVLPAPTKAAEAPAQPAPKPAPTKH